MFLEENDTPSGGGGKENFRYSLMVGKKNIPLTNQQALNKLFVQDGKRF